MDKRLVFWDFRGLAVYVELIIQYSVIQVMGGGGGSAGTWGGEHSM